MSFVSRSLHAPLKIISCPFLPFGICINSTLFLTWYNLLLLRAVYEGIACDCTERWRAVVSDRRWSLLAWSSQSGCFAPGWNRWESPRNAWALGNGHFWKIRNKNTHFIDWQIKKNKKKRNSSDFFFFGLKVGWTTKPIMSELVIHVAVSWLW